MGDSLRVSYKSSNKSSKSAVDPTAKPSKSPVDPSPSVMKKEDHKEEKKEEESVKKKEEMKEDPQTAHEDQDLASVLKLGRSVSLIPSSQKPKEEKEERTHTTPTPKLARKSPRPCVR